MNYDNCPNPMEDMEGYQLWCELHACPECDGNGEVDANDPYCDDMTKDCPYCEGSGVDPNAYDTAEDGE